MAGVRKREEGCCASSDVTARLGGGICGTGIEIPFSELMFRTTGLRAAPVIGACALSGVASMTLRATCWGLAGTGVNRSLLMGLDSPNSGALWDGSAIPGLLTTGRDALPCDLHVHTYVSSIGRWSGA